MLCAVVRIVVGAVHGAVTESDDPRPLRPSLWSVRLPQVLHQPLVLRHHVLDPILEEVVKLCGNGNEVNRPHVKRVQHRVKLSRHAESVLVLGKVTAKTQYLLLPAVSF